MSSLYTPGAPTPDEVAAHLEHIPQPAVVYLDWNVLQYLRWDDAAAPLLHTLLQVQDEGSLLVPFAVPHLQDATALWSTLSEEHRALRHRDMAFVDGVTGGVFWRIDSGRNVVGVGATMRGAANDWGYFGALQDAREDDPEQMAALDDHVHAEVARVRKQTLDMLEHMPPEQRAASEGFMLAVQEGLERAFADGLPDPSSVGSTWLTAFGPVFLAIKDYLSSQPSYAALQATHPSQAVLALDDLLAGLGEPGFSFTSLMETTQTHDDYDHDPDVLGPNLLGMLGYHPESTKTVKRAKPGHMADTTHGQMALASALFVTGDVRLALRVDAWAHHTGRGLLNGRWPVVCTVKPENGPRYKQVAEVVRVIADGFPGAAAWCLQEARASSSEE